MEIKLESYKPWKRRVVLGVFIIACLVSVVALLTEPTVEVNQQSLSMVKVQQQDIELYALSFGELAAKHERLLTAPAQGKVQEVLHRPGATVNADTVIVKLTNPQLAQQVRQAQGDLAIAKAKMAAFEFEQQNQLLDYQNQVTTAEASLEQAQLELTIHRELDKRGITAKLDILKSELAVKLQQKKLNFAKTRYQHLANMQTELNKQKQVELNQQQQQVSLLEQQINDMQVTAGIAGTIQEVTVALGENVNLGQPIAKVGSNKELIAKLRIPQRVADSISIGANVQLNIAKQSVNATINRIESVVTNGMVLAEAIIIDELPSGARPAMQVSAQVHIKQQENQIYVPQKPGLRARSKQTIFVVNNNIATPREVVFGEQSQNKLLVTSGLTAGETIIANNQNEWLKFSHITLIQ